MTTAQLQRSPCSQPPAGGSGPLREENVTLTDRIRELRRALAASTRENAQLRRALAQAHAENRHLRSALTPPPVHSDPRSHIRRMLSDSGSRNP